MACKMIIMSEREFRIMVQDWIGMLDDEERENTEALHEALRELFFVNCEHDTQGIIVWKGDMGCYPTELIWIEDAETFVEHALKAGLTEEARSHGETALEQEVVSND
jgi:alkyl hydroperoxide reductase subunit AhpC